MTAAKIISMSADRLSWGERIGTAADDCAPNRQNKEEGPDDSARYFVINLLRLFMLLKRRDGFGDTLSVCRVSL